ncbi:hypothetical protein BS50DRAFT_525791 [Corynespora cassiicola Philippines]|uniref:Uncharacterized protein n=1 Tax=Corynespora cassiicola Philippines TaxID=1448308 RepID=A0A2T2NKQ2_CORCC|nr:hypothetical protein BS50DRAFT_525791 [Corynespora cassiicola Philippines]
MSVSCPLIESPHHHTKTVILDHFWGQSSQPRSQAKYVAHSEAYWRFYSQECERALHDGGRSCLARTHQDLIDIVALFKEHRSRDEISKSLLCRLTKKHANEEELVNGAIDLAASIFLMIDFWNPLLGFSGRQLLAWSNGSIKECVHSHFCAQPTLGHEGVKLQRIFNALNLERIAGVQLVLTNNLADHLRLVDDDTKLYFFHHASFLRANLHSDILPPGLAEETLRTLALLCPQSDRATKKWLRRLPKPIVSKWPSGRPAYILDPHLMRCGHLKTDDRQIEKFIYWHDRLVVLKQVFDETTPNNISQWWHDRRNGVQWYTFWVAIIVLSLTLMFGLIQSIEGALQVYGSFQNGPGK